MAGFLDKTLGKFDTQIQLEATLVSLGTILLGLIVGGVYIAFWVQMSVFAKCLALVNALAGITLIFSYLSTAYGQLKSFKMAKQIQFPPGVG